MGTIRELTSHRVNGLNEALRIFVLDEPGAGNACHDYVVLVPVSEETARKAEKFWDCADRQVENMHEKGKHDEANAAMLDYSTEEDGDGTTVTIADVPSNYERTVRVIDAEKDITKNHKEKYYTYQRISFQNGPVKEKGYNGNSHEALLAILLDRMESFQAGPYACHDNQMALDHLQGARLWLHKRTMDRVARQVEGTHQK